MDEKEESFKFLMGHIEESRAIELYYTQSYLVKSVLFCLSFFWSYNFSEVNTINTPVSRNTKRKKRGQPLYENYQVMSLSKRNRTVNDNYVSPDIPEEDRTHMPLHIRAGHWRRPMGYRSMDEASIKEKLKWIEPTFAGDPEYGIMIKDYKTDHELISRDKINQNVRV